MAQVLVLEPDKTLAQIYKRGLSLDGHTVQVCYDAQDAICAADALTPDLAILELQLVGHSGIEFLYEFRSYADWRDVPVIILSVVPPAEFMTTEKVLRMQCGVATYLYKPITTIADLSQAVRSNLK